MARELLLYLMIEAHLRQLNDELNIVSYFVFRLALARSVIQRGLILWQKITIATNHGEEGSAKFSVQMMDESCNQPI